MTVSNKHVLQQGPVLAALGRAALAAMKEQIGLNGVAKALELPGAEITSQVPPRPRDLVRDYVKNVGGDPARYKRTLPPHLFPQWTFPIASKTLEGIPYPLVKVVNGGCRLEIAKALPIDEPLLVRGRLVDIDDDGYRAVLHQELVTSTASAPDALTAHLYAIVPLKRRDGEKPKAKPQVPLHAREIGSAASGVTRGSTSPSSPATSTRSTGSRRTPGLPDSRARSSTASPPWRGRWRA